MTEYQLALRQHLRSRLCPSHWVAIRQYGNKLPLPGYKQLTVAEKHDLLEWQLWSWVSIALALALAAGATVQPSLALIASAAVWSAIKGASICRRIQWCPAVKSSCFWQFGTVGEVVIYTRDKRRARAS